MKSAIRELYLNDIRGDELCDEENYSNSRKKCDIAYEKLYATFTDEQKKLFGIYYDADGDTACEWESYVFERGFKLGMILAIEALK